MAETAGGTEIPDIKKLDFQVLIQDLAQSRHALYEEKRYGEKRVNEERARSEWAMERMRVELQEKIKDLELGNKALIGLLSRMQSDVDALRAEKIKEMIPAPAQFDLKFGEPSSSLHGATSFDTQFRRRSVQPVLPADPSAPILGKTIPLPPEVNK